MRGVLIHNLDKSVMDGDKVISINGESEDRVETFKIGQHEIYAVDVVVTAGEDARGKTSELRTTVFKKNQEVNVDLKAKASRLFLNEILSKSGEFAFSIADFENEMQARVGLSECLKTGHL